MDLKKISDFIGRYEKLGHEERILKRDVQETLSSMGCFIKPQKIHLKGRTLFVEGHPALRHYFFLNKNRIIQKLSSLNKTSLIEDIR